MIMITGATGKVGSAVHRKLISTGKSCKILIRDIKKAQLAPMTNTQAVVGDFERPATLGLAFQGVKQLFLISNPAENQAVLHANVINAAKKSGVERIVRLSAYGAALDSPVEMLRLHAQSDQDLAASGIKFTSLRPSFFFQNFENHLTTLHKERAIYAPIKTAAVSMIDIADIAAAAVIALTDDRFSGKTLELTGPQAHSFQEAGDILGQVWGKVIKYVNVDPSMAHKAMIEQGVPPWLAGNLRDLYALVAAGKYSAITKNVQQVTGLPPRPFEAYCDELTKKLKELESLRLSKATR